jgi:hypothetical protein
MIIEKIFQTVCTFNDHRTLFTGDMEATLLLELNNRFKDVCFMSCLVQEVTRIVRFSNPVICTQRQNASVTCSVTAVLRGVIIKEHEILYNCEVLKIDKNGHIICKNDTCAIYIRASKKLQTIKQGQMIIAEAGLVRYNPFKSAISVNATPFVPRIDTLSHTIYEVTPVKNDSIDKLYGDMTTLTTDVKSANPKVYEFFIDLLYPYKNTKELDNDVKLVSIKQIIETSGKIIISRPDWLPFEESSMLVHKKLSSENILDTEELQTVEHGLYIKENYLAVMGHILQTRIEFLNTVKCLCDIYKTMDDVKNNNNIWAIYKMHKH